MKDLENLGADMRGEAVDGALRAGAAVLVGAFKEKIGAVVKRLDRSTSQLKNSIRASKVKGGKQYKDRYIDVYPSGKRAEARKKPGSRGGSLDTTRNAEVGFVLEYGKTKTPGTHWMSSAADEQADEVVAAMADELTNIFDKLGG